MSLARKNMPFEFFVGITSCQFLLLKYDLVNFDMLTPFSFGVSSNLSQQKSPTAEVIGIQTQTKV